MEALSFGIPVVATNVGGTHEIVNDMWNGYLLPSSFTNEMLLEAINNVLREENCETLRSRARAAWQSACDAGINYPLFSQAIMEKSELTGGN